VKKLSVVALSLIWRRVTLSPAISSSFLPIQIYNNLFIFTTIVDSKRRELSRELIITYLSITILFHEKVFQIPGDNAGGVIAAGGR
jgi:hypothetical protein